MRIIAGQYRRRKLLTNPGVVTRPYTDRVKESLFENIEQRLIDKRVADICAGTGTMGLEALSRGATCVTFIEKDKKAVELLKANIDKLDCAENSLVWSADIFRCSFRPKGEQAARFTPFDVIIFDPPYKLVPEIKTESPLWRSLVRLARPDVSAEGATLVIRVPEEAEYDLPPMWEVSWTMEMSRMIIHVCTKMS